MNLNRTWKGKQVQREDRSAKSLEVSAPGPARGAGVLSA